MPTQRRRTLGCASHPSRSSGACVLAALLSALPHALCQTDSSEPPPSPPPGHRQAPHLPPFPPPPPAPPAPLGPPPLPDATSGETLDVKSIYYIYAAVISGFALVLFFYCVWTSTKQLRALNAEHAAVVERRHFLEAQEARLTGRPLPDDHPDKAKEARGAKSSRRIPPAEV